MPLIVTHAALPGWVPGMDLQVWQDRAGADGQALEALATHLQHWHAQWDIVAEEDDLLAPHEHAWARLTWGDAARPPFPGTAWYRRQAGLAHEGAWGCLVPYHGLVGSDQITALDPDLLNLSDEQSRGFFEAVKPLFDSEGLRLEWHGALAWHVQHESLEGLLLASIDRASGESVQRWQGARAGAGTMGNTRLVRRLQNEAQMLLYQHPLNDRRREQGLLEVNSLWLHSCGSLHDVHRTGAEVEIEQALKAPLLQADLCAWLAAWHAIDLNSHELLVLCGPSRARAFRRRPDSAPSSSWLQRAWTGLRAATEPPPNARGVQGLAALELIAARLGGL